MKSIRNLASSISVLTCSLLSVSMLHAEVTKVEKPNIILILTDDQGYGDLGKHGHPVLRTPNLDKMYDESVVFDNFYVSPSCSPTRAALLTGMHEFRSGVTHTLPPREHLHLDIKILPQFLAKAGYATAHIGKWHLAWDKPYAPRFRGFQWCSINVGGPQEHFNVTTVRNGKKFKTNLFRTDTYFNETMTFIEECDGKPFFCYLNTFSPHTPLGAPKELVDYYKGKGLSEKHATYLGMCENIDTNVGRLLEYLKKNDLEKNTIVIYLNDNGQTEGLDVYNANMRGCKATIWEGGSRAMSIWRWPSQWAAYKSDNLTAHLDIVPTLCEIAGAPIPADVSPKLEGFSLLPLLEAKKQISWHDDRILYHHVGRWPNGTAAAHKYAMCAARQNHYLLLRSTDCSSEECKKYQSQCVTLRAVRKGLKTTTYTDGNAQYHWGVSPRDRWVLFDVKADPQCQKDLSKEKPEIVSKLSAAYDKWWDDMYPVMIAHNGDAGSASDTDKHLQNVRNRDAKKAVDPEKKAAPAK